MVLPRFVEQALSGGPLTVYGDGRQSRCFAYVSDVVETMVALSKKPEAVGEVFNIGSHEEITIEGLAKKVIETLESDAAIEYIPYELAYAKGFEDMMRRVPDTSKVTGVTGFKPKHELVEIIRLVAEDIRKRRHE